jgi:hypothetical protein
MKKIVLLFLLSFIGGCQVAGGGFGGPILPKNIICDKPWAISAVYSITPPDPREKRGKLTEMYKDVVIHIRYSSDSNFIAVPMAIESVTPTTSEIRFNAIMKPILCDSGVTYIECYIDLMINGVYERNKLYKVQVSKN